MSRHANISIFVPHVGCPHRCSFCNQNSITGQTELPNAQSVERAVQVAVQTPGYNPKTTQIAFFGGSFTAIEPSYMQSLLQAAYKYLAAGQVCGIRVSTRPDAVSPEILQMLKSYGVQTVELGVQSMDDAVLKANGRGHTVADTAKSVELLRQFGFEVGLQMMTGLYFSTPEADLKTAKALVELKPDCVRIYPTVVLKQTHLEKLYLQGQYVPQSLQQATEACSRLLQLFSAANIPVIRLGLHTLTQEDYVAGPWHPAFRELCESRLYLQQAKQCLSRPGNYTLKVHPSAISKMIGQRRENIEILANLGYNCKVSGDPLLNLYEISAEKM